MACLGFQHATLTGTGLLLRQQASLNSRVSDRGADLLGLGCHHRWPGCASFSSPASACYVLQAMARPADSLRSSAGSGWWRTSTASSKGPHGRTALCTEREREALPAYRWSISRLRSGRAISGICPGSATGRAQYAGLARAGAAEGRVAGPAARAPRAQLSGGLQPATSAALRGWEDR